MKKINFIITTFISASSLSIITPISTSCTVNSSVQSSNMNYVNEINAAQKHLITEQSTIDLNKMFLQNVLGKSINDGIIRLTRDDIAKTIVIEKSNLIYQELKKNNLDKMFEDEVIEAVYQSYLDEINKVELNGISITSRCGNFFSDHYWKAVGFKIAGASLFALSFIWWGVQLIPAIVLFINNYDVSGFADLIFDLPDFAYKLVTLTITKIKEFKKVTNCKWNFKIWNGSLYKPTIVI